MNMKATKLFSLAAAAAAVAAAAPLSSAQQVVDAANNIRRDETLAQKRATIAASLASIDRALLTDLGSEVDQSRELMHFEVKFEECLHKTFEKCKDIILSDHASNNALFGGKPSMDIRQSFPRKAGSDNYYLVGLRTNEAETGVVGVLGDGMIWYPWQWVLPDGSSYDIGPWDCDVGMPLSPEQCCDMIKASVPNVDINGNYIDCIVSAPIGSVSNPRIPNRVIITTNENNIVIREPTAE